jgi:hypothetical protein
MELIGTAAALTYGGWIFVRRDKIFGSPVVLAQNNGQISNGMEELKEKACNEEKLDFLGMNIMRGRRPHQSWPLKGLGDPRGFGYCVPHLISHSRPRRRRLRN